MDYKQYQEEVSDDIAEVLADAECQSILFVGSGFSKRYAGGPYWEELLTELARACPLIDKDFAYYKQANNGDLKKIGSVFSDIYREWAWSKGKGKGRGVFPAEYYSAEAPSDIFIKHAIADLLKGLGPGVEGSYGCPELDAEIEAFKHEIIIRVVLAGMRQMKSSIKEVACQIFVHTGSMGVLAIRVYW